MERWSGQEREDSLVDMLAIEEGFLGASLFACTSR